MRGVWRTIRYGYQQACVCVCVYTKRFCIYTYGARKSSAIYLHLRENVILVVRGCKSLHVDVLYWARVLLCLIKINIEILKTWGSRKGEDFGWLSQQVMGWRRKMLCGRLIFHLYWVCFTTKLDLTANCSAWYQILNHLNLKQWH